MRFKLGTAGAMEQFVNTVKAINILPCYDGKVFVTYEGEPIIAGKIVEVEVIKEVEIEVIKEVIKKVAFDNPELLDQIQTLQDALGDALNAEQAAKKEAEDLKKQIPKLKASVAKLKKALITED